MLVTAQKLITVLDDEFAKDMVSGLKLINPKSVQPKM